MAEPMTLTILDIEFSVSAPYAAGHTLTEAEAKALNQTRKENLGNNFRATVKKAVDAAAVEGAPEVDTAKLLADFAELDSKYEFTLANVAQSRKLDPVEREARNMVKAALRDALAAQTPPQKFSDLAEELQEKLIEANTTADVLKLAKNIVAQKQKAAGLALNLTGEPQTEAPAAE